MEPDLSFFPFGLFPADFRQSYFRMKLKKNNISFQEILLYETVIEERKKEELLRQLSKMDYVTFGSSSAVKAFVTMTKDYDGIMPKLVSIGPITTASMQEYGLNVTKTAKIYCVIQKFSGFIAGNVIYYNVDLYSIGFD